MRRLGTILFAGVCAAGAARAVPTQPLVVDAKVAAPTAAYAAEVDAPAFAVPAFPNLFNLQSPFDFTRWLKSLFRQPPPPPALGDDTSTPAVPLVEQGGILSAAQRRSMVRAIKRAPAQNSEDLSPEEEANLVEIDEGVAAFSAQHGPGNGGGDQVPDTQAPASWALDQVKARIFPKRAPKLKLGSGEWADTIDVVDYLYDRLKDARLQMSKVHPKTFKQLKDLCDLDVQIAKAERAGDGAAAQRAEQAKDRIRGSIQPDVKNWFTARYGATVAAAEMKRPMRAMAIYLLHTLSDTEEVIPGLSVRDLAAMAPTLNGEARNLDCPSNTKNQNAAAAEIRTSYDRRVKNEGRALNAKEKQMLLSLNSDIDKPWWAEPCRKSQMELVGTTILNRLEASKKNAAVEGMFLFPRQTAAKSAVRSPAQFRVWPMAVPKPPKPGPEFSPYRSVIESGSFSMWNEYGNPGGQSVACLMTGTGNYASEHQMKSALLAIRNLFARNSQGKPFVRGSPALPSGLQYFAMPAYAGKVPGRGLPRTVLTEGPPPANPRLGQVSISGSSYGIVGGPSGTKDGHIFKVD